MRGQVNMKLIYGNYDDVLRIAHSIREGKVSGALIMGSPYQKKKIVRLDTF